MTLTVLLTLLLLLFSASVQAQDLPGGRALGSPDLGILYNLHNKPKSAYGTRYNSVRDSIQSKIEDKGGQVFNVMAYGAVGDGVTDDTDEIEAAIAAASSGGVIYFPEGVYIVDTIQCSGQSNLRFTGVPGAIIRRASGGTKTADFVNCDDIVIDHLEIDSNGISNYGGWAFSSGSDRIHIHHNYFHNGGSPPSPSGYDRYAVTANASSDFWFTDNYVKDLEIEVDGSNQVIISRNIFEDSVEWAAIAIAPVGDGITASDYLISDNVIINPYRRALGAFSDNELWNDNIWERIIFKNNLIQTNTKSQNPALIQFGVGNTGWDLTPDDGQDFYDIVVEGNTVFFDGGLAAAPGKIINFNAGANSDTTCTRCVVKNNVIKTDTSAASEFAIDLRYMIDGNVSNNILRGSWVYGVGLANGIDTCLISENIVEATTTAYQLQSSLGNNVAYDNIIIGSPTNEWSTSGLQSTDNIKRASFVMGHGIAEDLMTTYDDDDTDATFGWDDSEECFAISERLNGTTFYAGTSIGVGTTSSPSEELDIGKVSGVTIVRIDNNAATAQDRIAFTKDGGTGMALINVEEAAAMTIGPQSGSGLTLDLHTDGQSRVSIGTGGAVTIGDLATGNGYECIQASNSGVLSTTGEACGTVEETVCYTIPSPTTADNYLWFRANQDLTITDADCIVENATSATVQAEECNTAGDSCSAIESVVCDTDGQADDGIDNSDVQATDWVRINVTATSGTPGHVTYCLTYTKG